MVPWDSAVIRRFGVRTKGDGMPSSASSTARVFETAMPVPSTISRGSVLRVSSSGRPSARWDVR